MDEIVNTKLSKIVLFFVVIIIVIFWLKISVALGWNLYGSAGIALGLLTGIPLCVSNWTNRSFPAGLLAGVIAVAAIGVNDFQNAHRRRERIKTEMTIDKSFIAALAEQKMMRQSPAFGGNPAMAEGLPEGVPMIADSAKIPARIMQEAAAEWKALPEAVKQKNREQRTHITQQSFGQDLELIAEPTPWILKIGMMFTAGLVAFVVAAAPAMIALKQ
jgi:hypothetical protein